MSDGASRKPQKLRQDGEFDGRGHAAGSKASRFAPEDGRKRPGRPKGAVGLKRAYTEAAALMVTVTDERTGKRRRISTQTAIALVTRQKALGGDDKAIKRFEGHLAEYLPEEVDPTTTATLIEEDQELLRQAFARGVTLPPSADDEAAA